MSQYSCKVSMTYEAKQKPISNRRHVPDHVGLRTSIRVQSCIQGKQCVYISLRTRVLAFFRVYYRFTRDGVYFAIVLFSGWSMTVPFVMARFNH